MKPDPLEAKAREAVDEWEVAEDEIMRDGHRSTLERLILAALRSVEQETIERCATVAEEHLDHVDLEKAPEDWQQHHEYPFRCNVAEAIRALGRKE